MKDKWKLESNYEWINVIHMPCNEVVNYSTCHSCGELVPQRYLERKYKWTHLIVAWGITYGRN